MNLADYITGGQDNGLPAPGQRKPSLLSRVASRLMPLDPAYQNILTPDEQQNLSRGGLRSLGQALLTSGGPQPMGTSDFLSRVGQAFHEVNFPDMAQKSVQNTIALRQYQQEQEGQKTLANVLAANPPVEGESDVDTLRRLQRIQNQLTAAGQIGVANQLNEMIKLHTTPEGTLMEVKSPDGSSVDLVSRITGDTIRHIDYDPKKGEPNAMWQRRVSLANEFTKATENETATADAFRNFNSAAGQKQSRARDQAVLFAFAHLVDPRTTLSQATHATEGEVHGVGSEFINLWNAVFDNKQQLDDTAIQTMRQAAQAIAANAHSQWQQRADYYTNAATRNNVDPQDVVDPSIWSGTPFGAPVKGSIGEQACAQIKAAGGVC